MHKVTEINHLIDSLGQQITKDIFTAVKRATSHLKQNAVTAGEGAPALGGTIMSEELKVIVASKADQQALLDLQATKANKIDTQLAMRWVEVINRQIKQITVLITEMVRFEVVKHE